VPTEAMVYAGVLTFLCIFINKIHCSQKANVKRKQSYINVVGISLMSDEEIKTFCKRVGDRQSLPLKKFQFIAHLWVPVRWKA
jgi:hypothetical protein